MIGWPSAPTRIVGRITGIVVGSTARCAESSALVDRLGISTTSLEGLELRCGRFDPLFDRAAIQAIGQWRFEPAKRGGEPVPWRMRVTVTFPES